jgi:hypothetical protein
MFIYADTALARDPTAFTPMTRGTAAYIRYPAALAFLFDMALAMDTRDGARHRKIPLTLTTRPAGSRMVLESDGPDISLAKIHPS